MEKNVRNYVVYITTISNFRPYSFCTLCDAKRFVIEFYHQHLALIGGKDDFGRIVETYSYSPKDGFKYLNL